MHNPVQSWFIDCAFVCTQWPTFMSILCAGYVQSDRFLSGIMVQYIKAKKDYFCIYNVSFK